MFASGSEDAGFGDREHSASEVSCHLVDRLRGASRRLCFRRGMTLPTQHVDEPMMRSPGALIEQAEMMRSSGVGDHCRCSSRETL
jgi:hypothetical protein